MGKVLKKTSLPKACSPGSRRDGLLYDPVAHFLLIAILGFLAYSNTFHSPFQWDEAEYIISNPAVKDLTSFMGTSDAPGMNPYSFKNRYIGYLTFALNYRVHGFNVTGYHIVNLAIHMTNAILVYFLVLLTLRTPYFEGPWSMVHGPWDGHSSLITHNASRFFPLAVALLFVAHPVQTEAVTYVFQRFSSLVSMFCLLSLVLYIKGRQSAISDQQSDDSPLKKGARGLSFLYYFLSFLSAVLAMKTKENAFTLPVIITLYEFLFFTGALKLRVIRLVPFLLTMLIIPLTVIQIEGSLGETMKPMTEPTALGYENLSRPEYFFTQFRVIVTYLRLLLFPVNQNVIYDYPIYRSLFEPPVLLSFLFLSSTFGAAVYLLFKAQKCGSQESGVRSQESGVRSQESGEESRQYAVCSKQSAAYCILPTACYRLAAFGILWFFITLSVESSVIPLAIVIDEYRVYLPSVGFFIAVTAGGELLLQRFTGKSKEYAVSSKQTDNKPSAYCLLLTPYSIITLFAVIVLILAAATYARNSLWTDKVLLWEDVVRKNSNSPKAYNNLGIAFYEKGHYGKAIYMYERAILLSPGNFFAYSNLGVAYAVTGRVDMAIDRFTRAIALDPDNSVVYSNLGHALRKRNRFAEAAEVYLKAVALNPYDGMAFYGLGAACASLGQLDDALNAYTRFAELNPQDPEAYRSRGTIYARKGDLGRAEADFQKACSLGSVESCAKLKDIR